MEIVCSIDNGYVQHCCVMLTSFFENNVAEAHNIHLLTEGLTVDNLEIIRALVLSYKGQFYYYLIEANILKDCPIKDTDHLSVATYYRLFVADILPANIEKVLYLDCDLIINDAIDELWNVDLKSCALAAVEEMGCSSEDVYNRLGYDSNYGYFNAGVLLINLAYWRIHKLSHIFLEYISLKQANIIAHDQDVLNATLHNKCIHLPYKWNVEEVFYHYWFIKKNRFNEELCNILRHPIILHYTWKPKPWSVKCRHPFRLNYFIYRRNTIFRANSRVCWLRLQLDKYWFCLMTYFRVYGKRFYKLK